MNGGICAIGLLALLSGCSLPFGYYEPATVENGVISNSKVGWDGYSISVPEGMTVFNPAETRADSASITEFQRWYLKEDRRHDRAGMVSYSERFLLEEEGFFISFSADTYSLSSGWGTVTSVESTYLLGKIANRKMVEINDDDAERTEILIKGQKGWHVSGTSRPYFKKDYIPLAYEGYFVLGKLREAFWIEGFGDVKQREVLKERVRAMAESLQIH